MTRATIFGHARKGAPLAALLFSQVVRRVHRVGGGSYLGEGWKPQQRGAAGRVCLSGHVRGGGGESCRRNAELLLQAAGGCRREESGYSPKAVRRQRRTDVKEPSAAVAAGEGEARQQRAPRAQRDGLG